MFVPLHVSQYAVQITATLICFQCFLLLFQLLFSSLFCSYSHISFSWWRKMVYWHQRENTKNNGHLMENETKMGSSQRRDKDNNKSKSICSLFVVQFSLKLSFAPVSFVNEQCPCLLNASIHFQTKCVSIIINAYACCIQLILGVRVINV